MDYTKVETEMIHSCKGAATENWLAWLDFMPPGPRCLHVFGEVVVGNLGIDAVLRRKVPQGFNPAILMLDLSLVQKPGIWPELVTKKHALYDEVNADDLYSEVSILCEDDIVADIPVEVVT